MFIDVVLIGILILANGFFAAAEMALVTTRRTRLKMLVKAGDQRAAKVLAVQDNPGEFLAMVQIGITPLSTCRWEIKTFQKHWSWWMAGLWKAYFPKKNIF